MLMFTRSRDLYRFSETDMDRFFGLNTAGIFKPAAHSPGVGFQCQGDHRDVAALGEFDSEGVKLLGVEFDGARCLGEYDDGDPGVSGGI